MKKNIFVLGLFFLFFSCRNDKNKEVNKTTEENSANEAIINSIKDNKVRINFKGIYQQDDLIFVFYSTKRHAVYSNKNRLTKSIVGSDSIQNIEIEFPENVRPYDLRIDFSDNKDQENIFFEEMLIADASNELVIDKNNLTSNFNLNNSIFEKQTSSLKGNLFNLKENVIGYNPYLYSNSSFRSLLNNFNDQNEIKNIDFNDGLFRVIIEGVFKSDDEIILFYTDDISQGFNLKEPIRKKIVGISEPQTIILELPKGEFLENFRLDISENLEQNEIEILKFSIREKESEISFTKSEISDYLKPNEYLNLEKHSGDFKILKIMDEEVVKYNPYFTITDKFVMELSVF